MEGTYKEIRRARYRLSVRTMNSGSPHVMTFLGLPAPNRYQVYRRLSAVIEEIISRAQGTEKQWTEIRLSQSAAQGLPGLRPCAGGLLRGSGDREQPYAEGDPAREEHRDDQDSLVQACPVVERRGVRIDEHHPDCCESEQHETRAKRVRRQATP